LSNRTTLAQIREMDTGQIAQLPIDHLVLLADDVAALKAEAKQIGDKFADALHTRFGDQAAVTRRMEGKDTGRVRLVMDDVEVVADLPKRTEWQQARLAEAVAMLRGWGEDPADYVAIEMSVPESRYVAWPPRIRALFEPARTVGTGRPTYTLTQKEPHT
jgi:hypothetical protein